jgi:hypothetical protein
MKAIALLVLVTLAFTANAAESHPTLPTRWAATVNEDEVGTVLESYKMVDRPTPANPSAKWTNFTDGSCQRLIFDPDLPNAARYLLGCDALDCCIEEQSGNHIEYQIPNVHPAALAPVKHLGKETINQRDGSKYVKVTCDVWTWSFGPETLYAFTTKNPKSNETILNRWVANIEGMNYTNDYFGYAAPSKDEIALFDAQFNVPSICNNAMSCGDAYRKGLISKQSLNFVRGGQQVTPTKSKKSDPHPTLPTMWTATVNEAEVGTVLESYIMVDRPTPANPSAKWTNFTDGSCQRLIFDPDLPEAARYLLGCDAVPCCAEAQEGNHMEYQIPNVHPAIFTTVKYGGKVEIHQTLNGKTITTDTDVYSWSFGLGKWYAFVTKTNGTNVILNRWVVESEGKNFTNDYFNYEVPKDVAAFKSQFAVPAVCEKAPSCGDLFKQGKLSEKSIKFLNNGLATDAIARHQGENKAVLMKLISNL